MVVVLLLLGPSSFNSGVVDQPRRSRDATSLVWKMSPGFISFSLKSCCFPSFTYSSSSLLTTIHHKSCPDRYLHNKCICFAKLTLQAPLFLHHHQQTTSIHPTETWSSSTTAPRGGESKAFVQCFGLGFCMVWGSNRGPTLFIYLAQVFYTYSCGKNETDIITYTPMVGGLMVAGEGSGLEGRDSRLQLVRKEELHQMLLTVSFLCLYKFYWMEVQKLFYPVLGPRNSIINAWQSRKGVSLYQRRVEIKLKV